MNTTRNTSSGKCTGYAFSGIVLFIVILFWIAGGQNSYSQGVGISEVAITPDTWSVLELRSTLRGFLAPRMTTAERNVLGLKPPAAGMLVYDTNTKSFWFYDGGWIAITGGSSSTSWNVIGNAGTTPGTHFIGTTDAKDLVFKANNVVRATIFSSTGFIGIGNANSGTIKANKELVFREDGDVFGTSLLRLRNRNAENGAIFQTISGEYLVDFIFKTSFTAPIDSIQRNIRFEARTAYAKTGAPSFHFGGLVIDYPTLSVGDNYAAFNKNVRMGTYPDATIPIPAPTAMLHFAAGTATVGTAPLKFTAGTNLTAAEDGAIEYDGTAFYSTPAPSSRGVSPSEYFIALSANYSGVNNNNQQKVFNTPANGTITLAGSTSYMFEGQYNISYTGGASISLGTSFLLGGGASISSIGYTAITAKGSTTYMTTFVTTQNNTVVTPVNGNNNVTVIIHGIVRMNNAGTFTPSFQFSGNPGNQPTIAANSYFKIYPVGSNTVTSAGNWN